MPLSSGSSSDHNYLCKPATSAFSLGLKEATKDSEVLPRILRASRAKICIAPLGGGTGGAGLPHAFVVW